MDADDGQVEQRRQVAELLRSHRELRGLSVKNAASIAGIGRSTWTDIEQAAPPMKKPETLAKAARAVGLDPERILVAAGQRTGRVADDELDDDLTPLVAEVRRLAQLQERSVALLLAIAERSGVDPSELHLDATAPRRLAR